MLNLFHKVDILVFHLQCSFKFQYFINYMAYLKILTLDLHNPLDQYHTIIISWHVSDHQPSLPQCLSYLLILDHHLSSY